MRKDFNGKYYMDYIRDYTDSTEGKEYIEIGFYNEASKEEETVDVQFILKIPVWEIREIIGNDKETV